MLLCLEVAAELCLTVARQDTVTLRRDTLARLLNTPRLVCLSVCTDEGFLQLSLGGEGLGAALVGQPVTHPLQDRTRLSPQLLEELLRWQHTALRLDERLYPLTHLRLADTVVLVLEATSDKWAGERVALHVL